MSIGIPRQSIDMLLQQWLPILTYQHYISTDSRAIQTWRVCLFPLLSRPRRIQINVQICYNRVICPVVSGSRPFHIQQREPEHVGKWKFLPGVVMEETFRKPLGRERGLGDCFGETPLFTVYRLSSLRREYKPLNELSTSI